MANHPPETLQKIIDLCEQKGWEKPSWYQGSYSLLTRGAETRVLPILRAHGISFLASHALASGFLTGKHVDADGNPVGRFANNTSYAAPEVAAAMKRFVAGCGAQGLPPVEVASRWEKRTASSSGRVNWPRSARRWRTSGKARCPRRW